MKTVKQVATLTGVSVRTLHYYDELGLLTPSEVTAAGYRLYGDDKLERLQQILFFRELDFPLREIARIQPGFFPARGASPAETAADAQAEPSGGAAPAAGRFDKRERRHAHGI